MAQLLNPIKLHDCRFASRPPRTAHCRLEAAAKSPATDDQRNSQGLLKTIRLPAMLCVSIAAACSLSPRRALRRRC